MKREADPLVLLVFEEEEKGTAKGEVQGSHTDNNFMRDFIQRNMQAPDVQRNDEESPLPTAHWQAYHNPNAGRPMPFWMRKCDLFSR